jgi:hypothetical protein
VTIGSLSPARARDEGLASAALLLIVRCYVTHLLVFLIRLLRDQFSLR